MGLTIMTKKIAAAIVNKFFQLETDILNPDNGVNVTWANINAAKDVWWADIPVDKFKKDIYLILNDKMKQIFYLISIKANQIKYPYSKFRKLREGYISVEISSSEKTKFIDIKSGGSRINFYRFDIETVDYGKLLQDIEV